MMENFSIPSKIFIPQLQPNLKGKTYFIFLVTFTNYSQLLGFLKKILYKILS